MSFESNFGLVRTSKLPSLLNCSRATVYNWIADGLLPRPLKIGEGFSALPASEITFYIDHLSGCCTDDDIRSLVNTIHERRNKNAA